MEEKQTEEKKIEEKQVEKMLVKQKYCAGVFTSFLAVLTAAGLASVAYMQYLTNQKLEQQVIESRKVYIYSLEDVLRKIDAVQTKQKFEADILELNKELVAAEEKIDSIKKAQVKADVSELYLKNLRLKREELMNNYQKTLEELTKKINDAVVEIAKEKQVSAVFLKTAIAATSPYVVDISDEVAKRIKK